MREFEVYGEDFGDLSPVGGYEQSAAEEVEDDASDEHSPPGSAFDTWTDSSGDEEEMSQLSLESFEVPAAEPAPAPDTDICLAAPSDADWVPSLHGKLGELTQACQQLMSRMDVVLMSDRLEKVRRRTPEWSREVEEIRARILELNVEVGDFWWNPHSEGRSPTPSAEGRDAAAVAAPLPHDATEAPMEAHVSLDARVGSRDADSAGGDFRCDSCPVAPGHVRDLARDFGPACRSADEENAALAKVLQDAEAARLALEDRLEQQALTLYTARQVADQRLALAPQSCVSPTPSGGFVEFRAVRQDEVAYCWPCISPGADGKYLEAHVLVNPDKLSVAVVHADRGDRCLAFSPEDGIVTREHKTADDRGTEGSWVQALPATGGHFEGTVGVAFWNGDVEFVRRRRGWESWESTGRISSGLGWFSGRSWLLPCLSFRDAGSYRVRVQPQPRTSPLPKSPAIEAHWAEYTWET